MFSCVFDVDERPEESIDAFSDVGINIRELDDVLMKDVGNKIADSGRCVIETIHQCSDGKECYLS